MNGHYATPTELDHTRACAQLGHAPAFDMRPPGHSAGEWLCACRAWRYTPTRTTQGHPDTPA
jgi:hypothetical protein